VPASALLRFAGALRYLSSCPQAHDRAVVRFDYFHAGVHVLDYNVTAQALLSHDERPDIWSLRRLAKGKLRGVAQERMMTGCFKFVVLLALVGWLIEWATNWAGVLLFVLAAVLLILKVSNLKGQWDGNSVKKWTETQNDGASEWELLAQRILLGAALFIAWLRWEAVVVVSIVVAFFGLRIEMNWTDETITKTTSSEATHTSGDRRVGARSEALMQWCALSYLSTWSVAIDAGGGTKKPEGANFLAMSMRVSDVAAEASREVYSTLVDYQFIHSGQKITILPDFSTIGERAEARAKIDARKDYDGANIVAESDWLSRFEPPTFDKARSICKNLGIAP
jgi:hypothetical protein